MSIFEDPFLVTVTPDLCDDTPCFICTSTPDIDDCLVCGYPTGIFPCSGPTPCLSGSIECLSCEDAFSNFDVEFLGGYVAGFSSRLGFGASESTVNIDIIIHKDKCSASSNPAGACCLPDGSCLEISSQECSSASGIYYANQSCNDNPCCSGCSPPASGYEGKLGYIYTFNMGSFCFKGILSNHTYNEDSSGYKYRVSLSDGRSILSNAAAILNGTYSRLPPSFSNSAINISSLENSVSDNTCGSGRQCEDFMLSTSNSSRGLKLKTALESINGKCLSVPVSNAGLTINVDKVINIVSDELRTNNTESSILELITLACNESGYDFFVIINNNNQLEVMPVNYKKPATDKALFSFVENLSAKDIVISKEYGEEMAVGTAAKNKRIVFGANISYLTRVRDFSYQRMCVPPSSLIPAAPGEGLCCAFGGDWASDMFDRQYCESDQINGRWYPHLTKQMFENQKDINGLDIYEDQAGETLCELQLPCSIINNPASIGAYKEIYITTTPLPSGSC